MVTATCTVTSSFITSQGTPGGGTQLVYVVEFSGSVSDGTVTAFVNTVGSGTPFTTPISTKINKLDRLVREAMAAAFFSATTTNVDPPVTGFVIDPEDIYIPFG